MNDVRHVPGRAPGHRTPQARSTRTRLWLLAVLSTAVAALVGAGLTAPSQASIAIGAVVSQDPSNVTPNVVDSTAIPHSAIYALRQVDSTMYAGGTFDTLTDASGGTTFERHNLVAFNAVTGRISPTFHPSTNGPVWAIAARDDSLFIAGKFTMVNGVHQRSVAKIDATTGALDPTFQSPFVEGKATDIRLTRGHLVVAGTFPKQLTSLNRTTGIDDGYMRFNISGSVDPKAGPTAVYRFSIDPDSTRLVAVGNFTSINHKERSRAFMVVLGTTRTSVAAWSYPPLAHLCRDVKVPDYLRGVDFSPDGSYFVIVASGYVPATVNRIGTDVCDAAARFDTAVIHPTAPHWINYTGGDTLHSVAVTDKAVYVQGHLRWLDNPQGKDTAGPGAVDRMGIGAIDPATGKALAWNPGKTRAVGGKVLYVTTAGLWVGSDGARFAGEYANNLAFLPVP